MFNQEKHDYMYVIFRTYMYDLFGVIFVLSTLPFSSLLFVIPFILSWLAQLGLLFPQGQMQNFEKIAVRLKKIKPIISIVCSVIKWGLVTLILKYHYLTSTFTRVVPQIEALLKKWVLTPLPLDPPLLQMNAKYACRTQLDLPCRTAALTKLNLHILI